MSNINTLYDALSALNEKLYGFKEQARTLVSDDTQSELDQGPENAVFNPELLEEINQAYEAITSAIETMHDKIEQALVDTVEFMRAEEEREEDEAE